VISRIENKIEEPAETGYEKVMLTFVEDNTLVNLESNETAPDC
jgi:hypothetical protein